MYLKTFYLCHLFLFLYWIWIWTQKFFISITLHLAIALYIVKVWSTLLVHCTIYPYFFCKMCTKQQRRSSCYRKFNKVGLYLFITMISYGTILTLTIHIGCSSISSITPKNVNCKIVQSLFITPIGVIIMLSFIAILVKLCEIYLCSPVFKIRPGYPGHTEVYL